jgi:hypothetical protein
MCRTWWRSGTWSLCSTTANRTRASDRSRPTPSIREWGMTHPHTLSLSVLCLLCLWRFSSARNLPQRLGLNVAHCLFLPPPPPPRFERVVSVLQNVDSNYDTDVFQGIFKAIKDVCTTKDNKCPDYTRKVRRHFFQAKDSHDTHTRISSRLQVERSCRIQSGGFSLPPCDVRTRQHARFFDQKR